MSGREAAKKALEKKKTPRLADVFINAFRKIGQDLIWTGAGLLNYPVHCLGCALEDSTSDSPKLLGTVIDSIDAIDELDAEKALNHPVMQGIIHSHHLIADAIGKETVIMPTNWGPLTIAARILGAEALMMATIDNPGKLLKLMDFSTELYWRTAELSINHPDICGMNISDPVSSGDMISPAVFRKFVKPFLKVLVDRARKIGKYTGIHICGDSTPILKDVLDINPAYFSIESKVDLKDAKEILGGKVCVVGNVSPTGKYLSGTPEDVINEGKECVSAWGDTPGFILSVGCDFPKKVPLENVMALMSLKSE